MKQEEIMKHKIRKIVMNLIIMATFLSSLGLTNIQIHAAENRPINTGEIAGTSANVQLGSNTAWWNGGIGKIEVNGETSFCIEPTTVGLGGTYSKDSVIPENIQDTLSLIVYYGWDSTAKTDDDYATTQFMIWQEMGANITFTGSFGSRYLALKVAVQNRINLHRVATSFDGGSYTVNLGESLTITDTKGVLGQFHIKNAGGNTVKIQGNNLIITPNVNTPTNTSIVLQKVLDMHVGASIAYRSSSDNGQDVGVFKVADPFQDKINLKVNKYVDVTLNKEDIETGTTAQGDARLIGAEYSLYKADDTFVEKKIIGDDLTLKFEKLMATDTYYIQESKAPDGYIRNPEKIHINPLALLQSGAVGNDLQYKQTSKEQVVTGNFELHKINTSGEVSEITKPEEGAEFMVVLNRYVTQYGTIEEAYSYKDSFTNREYDYLSTDATGYAKSKDLAKGVYVVKQVKGKVDMENVNDTWEFEVKEEQTTVKYIVNNIPFTSYLKLIKVDATTGKSISLSNATFKVFDVDKKEYISQKVGDVKVSEFSTDHKGYVVLPQKLKAGHYRLDEIDIPDGYLAPKEGVAFTITNSIVSEVDNDGDPIKVISIANERPTGELLLRKHFEKVDEKMDDEKLLVSGWQAIVKEDVVAPYDGKTIEYKAGDIYKNPNSEDGYFYTTEDEEISISQIPIGLDGTTLEFEEVIVPEGYKKADNFTLTWTKEDDTTSVIGVHKEVENIILRTDIEVVKTNVYTGDILKGVEDIEITAFLDKECTIFYETQKVDAKTGIAKFSQVLYGTELFFKETATHKDYYLSQEVIPVVVDKHLEGIGKKYSFTYANQPIPALGTLATGINGEKVLDPTKDNEMIDILKYENMDTSKMYTVVSKFIDKTTGVVIAEMVKEDVTLETHSGEFKITMKLPANTVKDGEYYFAEYVYAKGQDRKKEESIVKHDDSNDEKQTIKMETPSVVPTGDATSVMRYIGIGCFAIITAVYMYKKYKKNRDDE